MSEVKITYRGWAGHFICANQCRFRLNTLVELGDIRIVVSTVGLMEDALRDRDERDPNKIFREIGWHRHFETMAFHAKRDGEFWDADVTRGVYFESERSWPTIDDEWKANKGHIAVVDEIANGLRSGNTYCEVYDA